MVIASPITATNSPKLIDSLGKVAIVAYKESTDLLQQYFTESGFDCQVLRQQHQPEYKNYSQSYLVLLNHCAAWEIARQATKPTLIVEADFVPVINFSQHGLSKSHRADVLYGKLAFLPMYAGNSRLNFILIRLKARIKGIARLFLGKFLRIAVIKGSSVPGRLIKFALSRQLTLSL